MCVCVLPGQKKKVAAKEKCLAPHTHTDLILDSPGNCFYPKALVFINIYTHIYTCTHTYIRVYIHTYIYTHIHIHIQEIKEARDKGQNPKALVIINPGNPVGNCLSYSNLVDLIKLCRRERLVLLADEVFCVSIGTFRGY